MARARQTARGRAPRVGLRQVIGGVFAKWPLETTYVDMTDLGAVQAAMRPNTRLVLIETPSNQLLQITDLAEVARIARTGRLGLVLSFARLRSGTAFAFGNLGGRHVVAGEIVATRLVVDRTIGGSRSTSMKSSACAAGRA